MKKSIAVLGSTGSIGVTTLRILQKKKNLFNIELLAANSNYKKISEQILRFKPKYFIIANELTFNKIKNKFRKSKTIILNNYLEFPKSKKKIDITVSAIPGLAGLNPTIQFIKKTKKILLANKESIICGWSIIKKIANKNNTETLSIDSEHFSIKKLLENIKNEDVEKIYITASGGPFLNLPKKKLKFITPKDAIKHPKWSMGKKISVDSATLMNKILELMEAYKLFPYDFDKYEILIHPQSLVHAIVKLKNGITKLLYHQPDMTIPIANAIFNFKLNINKLSIKNRNIENLDFFKVDKKKFPIVKLIPLLNKYISTPIIINAANEILIDQFLKKKISYNSIPLYIFKVLKDKNYRKYAIYKPNNLKNIFMIDSWSRETTLTYINKNKIK